jgi:hypothetical protein
MLRGERKLVLDDGKRRECFQGYNAKMEFIAG